MPIDLRCPTCDWTFEAKTSAIGSRVCCPHCDARFVAEDPDGDDDRDRDHDERRSLEDRDVGARRRERPRPVRRKRSRRRRRSRSGFPLWAIFVPVLLVAAAGLFFLVRWAIKDDPNKLPSGWERAEVPNRFRVLMPGTPEKKTEGLRGSETIQYNCLKDDQYFSVAYTSAPITPERRLLPPEIVLNEGCAAFVTGSRNVELQSEWISLNGHRGKQLLLEYAPDRKIKTVMRMYLAQGIVFIVLAGAEGFSPTHEKVKRFFNSFELLVSNDQQPPIQKQPIQPQPPVQPKANPGYEEADRTVLGAQPADSKLTVAGSTVYLSDMNDFGGKPCATGWRFGRNGTLGKDTDLKEMMVVNGRRPAKGLGMHPPMGDYTRVCYSLGKKAKSFEGSVAISGDQGQSFSGVRFLILGDGKVLWRSNAAQRKGVEQAFSVDVSNVNILELRVHVEGGNNTLCWAVWADPLVKVK